MTDAFRIRVRKGDFELEVESSSRDFVEEKLTRYFPSSGSIGASAPAPRAGVPAGTGASGSRPISLKEFAKTIGPQKKTEIAATIAYFMEHHSEDAVVDWKPSEIAAKFTELRQSAPANPAMTIGSSDFFMKSSSAGRYKLSSTGVAWVESRPPE